MDDNTLQSHSDQASIREKQQDIPDARDDSHGNAKEGTLSEPDGPHEYITGWRLVLNMVTIFLSTLLAALEVGIVATAIPGISDTFHRLDDVGWYGSATFLLAGATAPMWGKIFKYIALPQAYFASTILYLIGSLVAALAKNSASVIIGRAFQGWGAAGTLAGSLIAIHHLATPSQKPFLLGLWMGLFMLATILGPIIGGALTSGASWRWCFWINLIIGGPILVLIVLFLRMPPQAKPEKVTWLELLKQLDLPGFALLLASMACLTLALQWGGITRPWSDGAVVATLVLFGVLTIAFVAVEWWQGERAMAPLRLLKGRLIWSNILYCFFINSAMYELLFYLPIYFQSIHNMSAIRSGVVNLPLLALFAVSSFSSGILIGKTRLLMPYQILGSLLMVGGTSLLFEMQIDTKQSWYLGAQAFFGFGIGLVYQIPMATIQGFADPHDVATASGIVLLFQAGSGAYFIPVGQSLFANRLIAALQRTAPQINPMDVVSAGATEIQHRFHGADLDLILDAYMEGLRDVFAVSLASAALTALLAWIVPFKRLPTQHASEADSGVSETSDDKEAAR